MSFLLAPARKSWSNFVSSAESRAVCAKRAPAIEISNIPDKRIRFIKFSVYASHKGHKGHKGRGVVDIRSIESADRRRSGARRTDVLGAWANADEAGWDSSQDWKPTKKPSDEREVVPTAELSASDPAMNKDLHRLD